MAKFTPSKLKFSTKHLLIDKANSTILIAATLTAAVLMFSVVISRALINQMSYQNKVISLRDKANKQIVTNINNVDRVVQSFTAFESAPESVIGSKGVKNSIVVLDALPSKYDFPALATSLENILKISNVSISGITGSDNEAKAEQESIKPQPIEMPFNVDFKGNVVNVQNLITNLERSIRPMQVLTINLNASGNDVQATVSAKTYYQPQIKFGIEQQVITAGNKTANTEATK